MTTTLPPEWEITSEYDSHRPLLYHAITNTPHDGIYEFGMGYGSTPVLADWYANRKGIMLISLESDVDWMNKFIDGYEKDPIIPSLFFKGTHFVAQACNYMSYRSYGIPIVFIDSKPGEQRRELIKKHSGTAELIIVHDTEPGADKYYHMADALAAFKYRVDFHVPGYASTTAISNKFDVTGWKGIKIGGGEIV